MKLLQYFGILCALMALISCDPLKDINDFYDELQDEEDEFLRAIEGLVFVDGGITYPENNPYVLTTADYNRSADSTVRDNNAFSSVNPASTFLQEILDTGFYGELGSFFFVRYDSVVKDANQNILLERIEVDTLAIYNTADTSWFLSPFFVVDVSASTNADETYTLIREDYLFFGEGGAYFDLSNNTTAELDEHISTLLTRRFYFSFREGLIYAVTFDVLINDGVNDRIEQRTQYYEIVRRNINSL